MNIIQTNLFLKLKHKQQNQKKILQQQNTSLIQLLTRRISSCKRCFFVSRVDASGFNFRVQRSLYKTSKLGLRCNVTGSTGGNMARAVNV
jgi:hypothetical protein